MADDNGMGAWQFGTGKPVGILPTQAGHFDYATDRLDFDIVTCTSPFHDDPGCSPEKSEFVSKTDGKLVLEIVLSAVGFAIDANTALKVNFHNYSSGVSLYKNEAEYGGDNPKFAVSGTGEVLAEFEFSPLNNHWNLLTELSLIPWDTLLDQAIGGGFTATIEAMYWTDVAIGGCTSFWTNHIGQQEVSP